MNMKKIISMTLAFILLLACGIPALAETELPDKISFDLESLGIVQGNENGDLELDGSLTRAEFASMIVRLKQMQDWPVQMPEGLTDVQKDDWFYEDVCRILTAKMMVGYGDGTFGPNDQMDSDMAMKVLVVSLGYDVAAQKRGGYPDGYRGVAAELGLLKNSSITPGTFTRADILRMIYNSLDVVIAEPGYSEDAIIQITDDTFRQRILEKDRESQLFKGKGIVTANSKMWIGVKPKGKLELDEIYIDNVRYKTDIADAGNYLGMEVDYYAQEGSDGVLHLTSIKPTKRNETITLTEQDWVQPENGKVVYRKDGRQVTLAISPEALFIKNMRLQNSYTDRDMTLERGAVTLIDNDGDSTYDIVDIETFHSYRVERVNGKIIYLKTAGKAPQRNFINFDDTEDVVYSILDAENNVCKPEDIQADDIVSVVESEDGQVCTVIIGQKKVTGEIAALEEDRVQVDNTMYELEPGFEETGKVLKVGDNFDFYLNYRGEICTVNEVVGLEGAEKYAYVAEVGRKSGMSTNLEAKLLLPGDFVETQEKSDVEDDTSVILKLKGQNSNVVIMQFSDRVSVNGVQMNAAELEQYFSETDQEGRRVNNVIRYRANANGEIKSITTPDMVGTLGKRVYNAKEKVFGKKAISAFGAEETTKVLMIPDYGKQNASEITDEDYLAPVEINDDQEYFINGYDMKEENECVRVLAITVTLKADSPGAIIDSSKMAVVESISMGVDEEGEARYKIYFWSDGVKKSYMVDDMAMAQAKNLRSGDIFYYAVSPATDQINKIIRIDNAANPSNGMGEFGIGTESNPEGLGKTVCGYVQGAEYQKIEDILNRRVDRITVQFDNGTSAIVKANSRNAPPVYLYDAQMKTIEVISAQDIIPAENGKGDQIMVHIKNSTVRGIVIVR